MNLINRHLVSTSGGQIFIMNSPRAGMKPEEALVLAAWLVTMAQTAALASSTDLVKFDEVLHAVQNT